MSIPFMDLRGGLEETRADWSRRLEGLFSRSHFVLGEEVAGFEAEFAREMGGRYAVGVGSGTDALELSLRAAGLGDSGKEVITTPLTAPFTGLAILAAGCRPRFADVEPGTLLLDPVDVARRVGCGTGAILPVHLYGQPAKLPAFRSIARAAGAVLFQDACQAHGASFRGRSFAAYSGTVAYSFYPTKNLGCLGDGGAVLTNNIRVARRLRLLRDGGRVKGHVSVIAARNSRLDEIHACFLRTFLPELQRRNQARRQLASVYEGALAGCPGITLLERSRDSVCHLFVIRARQREQLRRFLSELGIATAIHYPVPLHLQPAFRECGLKKGDLPNAEKACRQILSLPLWPGLREEQALRVADTITTFYR